MLQVHWSECQTRLLGKLKTASLTKHQANSVALKVIRLTTEQISFELGILTFEKPKPNKMHLLLNGSRHRSYARVMKIYSKVISRLVSAHDFYSQVV